MNPPLNRRTFLHRSSLAAGALALAPGLAAENSPSAKPLEKPDQGLVAFRISLEQWFPEDRFQGLLAFFRKYPGTADELSFFTSSTHPPLPLPEIQRRAERLAAILPRVRQEGMAAGINHLATMGHHEENLPGSLDEPWPRVMDPHGQVSRGSYCPAGEEFRAYTAQVYTALAQAAPDFLWIDDDVRLAGHMPIGLTCFCPGCLARFSATAGRAFTRESLLAAFGAGPLEERLALRRRWLEHNRATIDQLFQLIERTVHQLRPALPLGFMTGDRFYEGYAFGRWAKTLAGPEGREVRWRPGGGFYSDESLAGLVGKAHDIGRQVAQLPAEIRVIQSEIENFPYQLLRKSAETTVVEALAHMAAGATGAAFNVLAQRSEPLGEYEPLLRRIHQARPFCRVLRRELGRAPLLGVWPAWNRDSFASNSAGGSWPEGPGDAVGGAMQAYVLGEIGLPLCHGPAGARVTALSGPGLTTFSPAELRQIFTGGVLMDLPAWQALQRLGRAEWTGVQPGPVRPIDAIEVLSDHPLNGRFAGWSRDCRQSFWHEPATSLELTGAGAVPLARMIDYSGRDLGVSMSAFTNALGGRVVVMGYFPWSQIHNLAKSSQLKAVCGWLGGGRLPVRLETFARIHLWVREPGPGRLACVLLNGSLDPATEITLGLNRPWSTLTWTAMNGESRPLKVSAAAGTGACQVQLPGLGPWAMGLLRAED